MLPRKRVRKRSGIKRSPEREWPKHERFIRSLSCILSEGWEHVCIGKVRCCHYRSAANSGTGIKPPAWYTFPACDQAHGEQHRIGQIAFEKKYAISLEKIALGLAKISPDLEMKKAMKEWSTPTS